MSEILALIPARGGSKGIPRKNIRDFGGAPLIAWSIACALQAKTPMRVVVSTDDEEIASVARAWGAETPFMRPAELAADRTTDFPVLEHALDWLAEHEGYRPKIIVQLRPTSPIRPVGCLDEAIALLRAHPQADCVRGVVPAGENPYKMWTLDPAGGGMRPLLSLEGVREPYNAPRQLLPDVYWQTGHIDAIRTATIREKNSLSGDLLLPLLIESTYKVDIDLPEDWARSEALIFKQGLHFVDPLAARRTMPMRPELLVLDFDGVFTDDRALVSEDGHESVYVSRADGYGLSQLREKTGVKVVVLSREANPVVGARCKKLGLPCVQACTDKATALRQIAQEAGAELGATIYVGNDLPDLPAYALAGYNVAPADAHPQLRRQADLVLQARGGHGAIRELCEILLAQLAGI